MWGRVSIILACVIVVSADDFDLGNCGKTVGCVRKPEDCSSFDACDGSLMWYYNNQTDRLQIQVTTRKVWVAFGTVLPDAANKMVGLWGMYCIRGVDAKTPSSGFFTSKNKEPLGLHTQEANSVVTKESMVINNDILTCRFSRPLGIGSEGKYLHNLETAKYRAVAAFSDNAEAETKPSYHGDGNYAFTAQAVNFKALQGSTDAPVTVAPVTVAPVTDAPPATTVPSTLAPANTTNATAGTTLAPAETTMHPTTVAPNARSSSTNLSASMILTLLAVIGMKFYL